MCKIKVFQFFIFLQIFAIPYLGKTHGVTANESVPEFFFREVTKPIHGTGRTVTIDNWFTTIPLLLKMLEEPYKLTITGTLRKNKREIPDEMKVCSKTVPRSKFCYTDKITFVCYTPKKNKIVLVVSTYMLSNAVTDGKPNMILHYNHTKGGTDTFDQLCHSFTTARRTKRWPLREFFGMLDQAAVNARILHKCKLINEGKTTKISAQSSLEELIRNLVKPSLQERLTNVHIRKDILFAIRAMLGVEQAPEPANKAVSLEKRVRCLICSRNEDKKTTVACCSCLRPMCQNHRSGLCVDCAGQN